MERKFHWSESSLYGVFAPGNESAEERKGQLPNFVRILNRIVTNSLTMPTGSTYVHLLNGSIA